MVNSSGGIIIYGIKEFDEVTKRHLPETITPINCVEFSKEWLEQIINNIKPKIAGVVIHPVLLDIGLNQVVYVVEIPQSDTAHQATDKRYYKRYNFQSVPMDDYEIRDVMHRAIIPNANLKLSLFRGNWGHPGEIHYRKY